MLPSFSSLPKSQPSLLHARVPENPICFTGPNLTCFIGATPICFTGAMTRKRKKEKRRKPYREEERISELPDDILCHILSFLPTEEAIATCTLSTRRRFLWTLFPTLDFKITKPTTHEIVINKFLSLRTTKRITRFHLNLKNCRYWSPNGHKWVLVAIAGKVEHFNISLCKSYQKCILSIPTLFPCTTIITLKLTCSVVPHFLFLFIFHLSILCFSTSTNTPLSPALRALCMDFHLLNCFT